MLAQAESLSAGWAEGEAQSLSDGLVRRPERGRLGLLRYLGGEVMSLTSGRFRPEADIFAERALDR